MVLSPPWHKKPRSLSPRSDHRSPLSRKSQHLDNAQNQHAPPQRNNIREPSRPSVATNASQFVEECPWRKRPVDEDGGTYYRNELTGDSTWDRSANEAVDDVPSEQSIDGEEQVVAEGESGIEEPIRHVDVLTPSTALLAKLLQLLCQHPEHSILLSDVGVLLDADLRAISKELGGLRNFVSKFTGLFTFIGKPGKEKLALVLGTASSDVTSSGGSAAMVQEKIDCVDDSVLQLRGLPFRATVAAIKSFLGRHADSLKDDDASVQIIFNRKQKPSGYADIHFCSPESARLARDELHMQSFDTAESSNGSGRYIEAFLAKHKISMTKFSARQNTLTREVELIEKTPCRAQNDEIAGELRNFLSSQKDGRILLSMVGVNLSIGARDYMKRSGQSLKHLISEYPESFAIEGMQGREWVSRTGTLARSGNPYVDT